MAEHKRLLEIVLMPLVLAVVGTVGTYVVTDQQQKSAEESALAQREAAEVRADADRQLKIIGIFADKMTSSDENDRIFAIYSVLSLDPDLAAKLLPTFGVYESGSERFKKILGYVTEAIVLERVAAPETATDDKPPVAATIDGRWLLRRQDRLVQTWSNWLEMELDDTGTLRVNGNTWTGEGELRGRWGFYDWIFTDRPDMTGRTDIYLDEAGILYGRVKGSGLDWTYWAMPATSSGK